MGKYKVKFYEYIIHPKRNGERETSYFGIKCNMPNQDLLVISELKKEFPRTKIFWDNSNTYAFLKTRGNIFADKSFREFYKIYVPELKGFYEDEKIEGIGAKIEYEKIEGGEARLELALIGFYSKDIA